MAVLTNMLAMLLSFVPADANAVIVVPELDRAMSGVKAYALEVGVPADELRMLDQNWDIDILQEHVNRGPAVVVFPSTTRVPVVLVSLTDTDAFLEKHGAKPGEVFMTPPQLGAKTVGDVLVMSENGAGLDTFDKPADPLNADQRQALVQRADKHDVVAWINMPQVRPQVMMGLTMARGMMQMGLAQAQQQRGPDGAAQVPMVWAPLLGAMADDLMAMVQATDSVFLTMNADADDVELAVEMNIMPDTPLGTYLAAVAPATGGLFDGAPQVPHAAFGISQRWKVRAGVTTWTERFMDVMAETLRTLPATDADIDAMLTNMRKMTELARAGGNVVMGSDEDGKLIIAGSYFTDQPQELMRVLEEYSETTAAELGSLFMQGGSGMETSEGKDVTIAGKHAKSFTYRFNMPDPMQQKIIEAMYGDETTYLVFPLAGGVGFAMGQTESAHALAKQLIADSKAGYEKQAGVQKALSGFSSTPEGVLLIDLVGYLGFVEEIMAVMPMPVPFRFGLDEVDSSKLEPIGVGLQLEDRQIVLEIGVPAKSVGTVVEAVQRSMNKMQEQQRTPPAQPAAATY